MTDCIKYGIEWNYDSDGIEISSKKTYEDVDRERAKKEAKKSEQIATAAEAAKKWRERQEERRKQFKIYRCQNKKCNLQFSSRSSHDRPKDKCISCGGSRLKDVTEDVIG